MPASDLSGSSAGCVNKFHPAYLPQQTHLSSPPLCLDRIFVQFCSK